VINNFYNSMSNGGGVDKAELIEQIRAAIYKKSAAGSNKNSSNGNKTDSKNASGAEGTVGRSPDLSKAKNEASVSHGSNNGQHQ
jgi:hypothetical protein